MVNNLKSYIYFIIILFFTLLFVPNNIVYAGEVSKEIKPVVYSFGRYGDYDLLDKKATIISDSIVSVSISGDINKDCKYKGTQAFGVKSGNVVFSLNYDATGLENGEDKYLLSDDEKTINGEKIDSKIQKGAFLFQKSEDGKEWKTVVNPIVNLFEDNPNGIKDFYKSSGKDVNKGCFYRAVIVYKIKRIQQNNRIVDSDFLYSHNDKVEELYKCFVCNNSGDLSIHNLSVDKKEILNIDDGMSSEVLLKGETLLNYSVTSDGFSIDSMGIEYKSIKVNNKSAKNGEKFTKPGKYTITVRTKLDYLVSKNVYIYDGGKDKGYTDYFGDNFIKGNRVFREGEYPSYAKGTLVHINEIKSTIPNISGTINNLSTGEKIKIINDRQSHIYKLKEGNYYADLYSGNITAGSIIHYEFRFNILDEDSKPYINYNELMTNTRICDLATPHYEVVYQTTRGGYIFVCFESETEAFKYAYEIEKRFIEKNENGEIYYKSLDNPNEKVVYPTDTDQEKMDLTSAINYYAKQNVEKAYFDATKSFSYQTFNNGNELLDSLETMSIAESIAVFPSEEEKEKLLDKMPYLNGFTFMHVDDYDVKTVEAECIKDGKTYPIRFGIPVDEQLSVSSKYIITETNKYEDEFHYDAFFMDKNETVSQWKVNKDGKETDLTVSNDMAEDGILFVTADALSLDSISNIFDKYAIISVSSKEAYNYDLTCLNEEAKGLVLYKKGTYSIKFVDRAGHYYILEAVITGNQDLESIKTKGRKTYTEIYNEIHINEKPLEN